MHDTTAWHSRSSTILAIMQRLLGSMVCRLPGAWQSGEAQAESSVVTGPAESTYVLAAHPAVLPHQGIVNSVGGKEEEEEQK